VQELSKQEQEQGIPQGEQLAWQLFEDFGRFGPAEQAAGKAQCCEGSCSAVDLSDDADDVRIVHDFTAINSEKSGTGVKSEEFDFVVLERLCVLQLEYVHCS
jgi:hypothetical protein